MDPSATFLQLASPVGYAGLTESIATATIALYQGLGIWIVKYNGIIGFLSLSKLMAVLQVQFRKDKRHMNQNTLVGSAHSRV